MTLLPSKHVPTDRSIIGLGALLLESLETGSTINGLWERVKPYSRIGSFSNFILTLDYLYAIGAIEYDNGFLSRPRQ